MGADRRRCRGRATQRRPKSMRSARSCASQLASRSRWAVSRAPGECAVGIGGTVPDEALVEMGVDIDETRHHQRAARIDDRKVGFVARLSPRVSRRGCARAGQSPDRHEHMTSRIRLHTSRREHAMGHARIVEAVIAGRRDRQEAPCVIMRVPVIGGHARPPACGMFLFLLRYRAFVPAPQEHMREGGHGEEDDHPRQ